MNRIRKYRKSAIKWIKAGRPKRTDKEISSLLVICKACENYQPKDDQSGKCGLCGCHLSLNGPTIVNKLRMATETCPDSRWT